MVYNITGIAENSTSLLALTRAVNEQLMFGWFGILLLIGINIVLFLAFMYTTDDIKKAAGASAFICFALAISLVGLGLAPNLALFIPLVLAGVVIALAWGQ